MLIHKFLSEATLHTSLQNQQDWPVGAMVARGPPKAKVVGSSPISVVVIFFLLLGFH
jgi:hypothetical protein